MISVAFFAHNWKAKVKLQKFCFGVFLASNCARFFFVFSFQFFSDRKRQPTTLTKQENEISNKRFCLSGDSCRIFFNFVYVLLGFLLPILNFAISDILSQIKAFLVCFQFFVSSIISWLKLKFIDLWGRKLWFMTLRRQIGN